MADSVYRVIEVIGIIVSTVMFVSAVETASGSLRDLRIAEVTRMDVQIQDGKVTNYRTRLNLSFKYEPER